MRLERAAERSIGLCLDAGLQPWRLELPGAKDPDEFIQNAGAAAFEQQLPNRLPLVEWVVQRRVEAAGFSAAGKGALIEELLPILSKLPGDLISRIAARTGVPEPVLHKNYKEAQGRKTLRQQCIKRVSIPVSPVDPPGSLRETLYICFDSSFIGTLKQQI